MSDLLDKYITHLQSIIDQLYADLDTIPEGTDTTAIKASIQRLEDALHHYEK